MGLGSSCCQPLESVEAHRAFNRHVWHGYRPSTGKWGCVRSLFYMHNETVNVYSHGIYLIFLLTVLPSWLVWPSNSVLWWLVFCNWFGHVLCMFGSVIYHLFNSLLQSASEYWSLLQLDILGIWVANSMNTFTYLYVSFYCDDGMRYFTMALHGSIAVATFLPSLRARTPATRAVALSLFLLVRIVTTTSRQLLFTSIGSLNNAWYHYTMTDVFLFIGAIVNAARLPEKLWPGRFNIAFTSHQLFHFIVILALRENTMAFNMDVETLSQAVCAT